MVETVKIDSAYKDVFANYPDILTVKDVCKMLRIDSKKAYKLIKSGEMKSIRLDRSVRIAKVWVLEYLQQRAWDATQTVVQERRKSILAFCKKPHNRVEMQRHLGMIDKNHFRTAVLNPMLSDGVLVRTIPEIPNHIKQKYVVPTQTEE